MITSHTYDLEAGRRREAAIYLHIGRMTVKAAAIDEDTTYALARVLAMPDADLAARTFEREGFGTKKRFLERALPDSWASKRQLLAAMQRVEEYRNKLAHSTVHTTYSLLQPAESTRLYSVRGGWTEPSPADFAPWEARADLVRAALWTMAHADDQDPYELDARTLAVYHYGALPAELEPILDELFPAF